MSNNPFKVKYGLKCDGCFKEIFNGSLAFFDAGKKYCPSCAEIRELICSCGNYKKIDFRTCYGCFIESREHGDNVPD